MGRSCSARFVPGGDAPQAADDVFRSKFPGFLFALGAAKKPTEFGKYSRLHSLSASLFGSLLKVDLWRYQTMFRAGIRRQCCVSLFLVTLLVTFGGACWKATAQQPTQDWGFLLAGMRKGRSALRSGSCRINGTKSYADNSQNGNVVTHPVKIYAAFEGDAKYRFDLEVEGWIVDQSTAKSADDPDAPTKAITASMRKASLLTCYCRNGMKEARWMGTDSGNIYVDANRQGSLRPTPGCFDVRALGLYHVVAFNDSDSLDKLLLEDLPAAERITKVDKSDPRVWTVVWDMSDRDRGIPSEWQISIDVEHEFTPVRFCQRTKFEQRKDAPWSVAQESIARWELLKDAWVPVHSELSSLANHLHYSFDITWESVNKPIDGDVFDWQGFPLPRTIGVVDNSLGQAIFLREPQSPPLVAVESDASRIFKWVAEISGLVVVVLLIWRFHVWRSRALARNA